MNSMATELKKVDDIKNNFIAIASHQLRTPATAVKQNLGLIIEGYATKKEDKDRFVRAAFENNESQLAIISDILDVARIQSGTMEINKVPTDLAELAAHAADEQRMSLKEGQSLQVIKPKQPVKANIDFIKIRMCVGNLISNAIKYTPEKGNITVRIDSRDGLAQVTVSDTGVGIAAEDTDKLFGRFSRISNALSSKVSGTGIGLYLVKQIIELHGGTIKVESTVGKGSSFILLLPENPSTDSD
jgi:signal transduction histidine kinase